MAAICVRRAGMGPGRQKAVNLSPGERWARPSCNETRATKRVRETFMRQRMVRCVVPCWENYRPDVQAGSQTGLSCVFAWKRVGTPGRSWRRLRFGRVASSPRRHMCTSYTVRCQWQQWSSIWRLFDLSPIACCMFDATSTAGRLRHSGLYSFLSDCTWPVSGR